MDLEWRGWEVTWGKRIVTQMNHHTLEWLGVAIMIMVILPMVLLIL